MQIDSARVIRAIRLSIAITIGFVLAYLFHLPHATWVPVTIIVILFDQYTVGGTLQRGILRITATIISVIISILIIIAFNNNTIVNNIAIIIGTFIYAYLYMDTKQSYIGALGAITLAMVLTDSIGIKVPEYRALEIILGVIITITVMMFFMPQYAQKQITILLAESLHKLESTLIELVDVNITLLQVQENFMKVESGFLNELNQLNRVVEESKFEIKTRYTFKNHPAVILHLRRIYRLVGVILFNISHNDLRYTPQIMQQIINVAHIFHEVQRKLVTYQFNCSDLKLDESDLNSQDLSPTHGDRIFIYSLVQCLAKESNLLVQSLNNNR